jgi:hypothetical protein
MIISYNVDNCGEALETLKRNKVRLLDEKPRHFKEYNRYFAFIHPAAAHGILTEIIDGTHTKGLGRTPGGQARKSLGESSYSGIPERR